MTRRRFFAPPDAFASDGRTLILASDEARHLRDVLRLKGGDEVFVFDGEGKEYRCIVSGSGRDAAKLDVEMEVDPARPESPLDLTLAVSLLKGEKFDLVVQKATELGVTRVVPVVTKLADVRVRADEPEVKRRAVRWQRIALEAVKQSGRARVPEVGAPVAFAPLIESTVVNEGWRWMFAERMGRGLLETINQSNKERQAVTALIGPEGGWTDEEIAQAHDAGWSIITLGGRTLRAETAAIAVTALLQHLFGDLT